MSIDRKTKHFAIGFAFLAVFATAFVLWNQFGASRVDANWEYLTRNTKLCTKHGDLAELKSLPQLILFVDNVNAVQGVQSRVVMRELVESLRQGPQAQAIAFRRVVIDLDGSGEIVDGIADWVSDQDAAYLIFSGYGAILWARNGTVIDSVNYAHDAGIADVLSRTHRAFPATVENNGAEQNAEPELPTTGF
jgi:hypothetical protein